MSDRGLAETDGSTVSQMSPNSGLARGVVIVLALSAGALATTPLLVAGSYSIIDHTLSESGGQGVAGAWLFRTGVVLASIGVFILTYAAGELWPPVSKWLLRLYALALLGAAWFSESPWDGRPYDESEAFLHTVFTVSAGSAFILGVLAVSRERTRRWAIAFDWLVVLSIALLPQVMLITELDGVLQRFLVVLGYSWLFLESARILSAREPASRIGSRQAL